MPLISNQNNFFCEKHFVFLDNSILVESSSLNKSLTIENLPSEKTMRKFLENQFAADWYAESELNYSAMMLDADSPIPSNCILIPLRQFFWDSKTETQKTAGIPSPLASLAARAHGLLLWRAKMRYCTVCGASLHDDPQFTARKCIGCGKQYFPRIEPAIIVLVSRKSLIQPNEEEILLARHVQRNTDVYSCIAGFVELGENLEQCVAREVKEETSIEIKNIKYVGSQSWTFPDQLMLAYTAEYAGGEICVQEEELSEARWFARNELPAIPKAGSVAYNLIHGYFK